MAGAIALLLAAATLLARRPATWLAVCAAQPVAIAAAVLAQGASRGEMLLAATAATLMLAKAVALWMALWRGPRAAPPPVAAAPFLTLAALIALVALFVARQALPQGALLSNSLALVLALALTGPLIAVARPAPWSLAGVLAVESGAGLAATALAPSAALTESVLALLAGASLWTMLRADRAALGGA